MIEYAKPYEPAIAWAVRLTLTPPTVGIASSAACIARALALAESGSDAWPPKVRR